MTVSFVGADSAEATSLTLPAHQAGDLIIVAACSNDNTAPITVPAGWSRLHVRNDDTGRSLSVGYKIATSSAEVSGTWTNGVTIAAAVYRHATNFITIGGMRYSGASSSTNLTYGPLTSSGDTAGILTPNQFCIAVGMIASNSLAAETAPTGFTNRTAKAGASYTEIAIHDTNGTVASVGTLNVALGGTSRSMSVVASIEDTGISKASGGIQIARGMHGGMRG